MRADYYPIFATCFVLLVREHAVFVADAARVGREDRSVVIMREVLAVVEER